MLYVGCDFRMRRTREIVSHSDDAFGMVMNLDGIGAVSQCGRDVSLRLGDAATITNMELATYMHFGSRHIGLIVPRAALTPMVPNLEDMAGRLIPRESEALRLLVGYLQAIQKDVTLAGPELRHLSVTHVHDLLAVSIGATREGAALAERRGLRAARLRAIKADIARNSGDERLTVADVAARQRITPRYVQSLFKMEDTTFSEFLLQQRLSRAYRMLMDLRHRSLTSSTIAFEVGFGDLSYFHRTFRRRYAATPSDVRKI
jgi:AraC-like DNA-binding protein